MSDVLSYTANPGAGDPGSPSYTGTGGAGAVQPAGFFDDILGFLNNSTGDSLEGDTNPFGLFDDFGIISITKGYTQFPKIFIINSLVDGTISRDYSVSLFSGTRSDESHNYPMWFVAANPTR